MADGYQALSEKEKEALRLLLDGHDAKSMASELCLSVHTVNERLRDARRKLSVSSSKAAARILRDAEAATPQLLVDKFSGDAGPAPSAQTFDPGPARSQRRAAWTIGGIAMIALFVAALALSSPDTAAPPTQATAATAAVAESNASRAARDWLALVDARKWQESWAATGVSFRSHNTLANWQSAAEQVHARLGPALSRVLFRDDDTPAPPNGYRTVRFHTTFPNNHDATEVLSLSHEGDRWRVVGIYVE
jgi:DNA-binding CsgD family transcriptional regulator